MNTTNEKRSCDDSVLCRSDVDQYEGTRKKREREREKMQPPMVHRLTPSQRAFLLQHLVLPPGVRAHPFRVRNSDGTTAAFDARRCWRWTIAQVLDANASSGSKPLVPIERI